MHHALLLVLISLVCERVERKDRIVFREDRRHERRPIEIVSTRLLIHELDKGYRGVEYRVPKVPVSVKVAAHRSNARVKIESLERSTDAGSLITAEILALFL